MDGHGRARAYQPEHQPRRRLYRINTDGVGALRAYLDRFWNQSLTAFKQAAEQPSKEVT